MGQLVVSFLVIMHINIVVIIVVIVIIVVVIVSIVGIYRIIERAGVIWHPLYAWLCLIITPCEDDQARKGGGSCCWFTLQWVK
jgi:hypothetical protein